MLITLYWSQKHGLDYESSEVGSCLSLPLASAVEKFSWLLYAYPLTSLTADEGLESVGGKIPRHESQRS